VVEAGRNGTKGMCCGAGGARMWMEESIGKKVNDERAQEMIGTGATRVATACPFCYIMLDDGVKGVGPAMGIEEDSVRVADISMHLLEAVERGEQDKPLMPRYIAESFESELYLSGPDEGSAVAVSDEGPPAR
jgi:hypothetical protein